MTHATGTAELRPLHVEANGINVIAENERKGQPRDLFWPWFAANISVLGLSYGSFELGFGISFWQAIIVGVAGIVLSFLACGFIAVAGRPCWSSWPRWPRPPSSTGSAWAAAPARR
jgi:NCS1 family nucleobase:cation symporter-1